MNDRPIGAEQVVEKIRDIARTTFGLELEDETKPIKEFGLDSLALIDIVMGLEEHFGCQLPLEKLPPDPTVKDFVALVQLSLASA